MSEPFLETLTRRERLAYPIVQRAVREGVSSRALTTMLQEQGLGVRRQRLLDLMRVEKDVQVRGSQLRFLHPDSPPNPERLAEALTKIRRDFSFTVEVRGTLISTGESFIQHVTVTTDQILTRRSIEDLGLEAVERGQDRYGIEVDQVMLTGGLRAGTLGHF